MLIMTFRFKKFKLFSVGMADFGMAEQAYLRSEVLSYCLILRQALS